METVMWLTIMIICSLVFTGLGIYARKRETPMAFWSGTEVKADEITDIQAYNKANGKMWLCFSLVFWVSTITGVFQLKAAAVILIVGCLGGLPCLIFAYSKIYNKYKAR